jgi:hypothetical protein
LKEEILEMGTDELVRIESDGKSESIEKMGD